MLRTVGRLAGFRYQNARRLRIVERLAGTVDLRGTLGGVVALAGGVQGLCLHRSTLFSQKRDILQGSLRSFADALGVVPSSEHHRHLDPAALARTQERRAEDPLRERILDAVYDFCVSPGMAEIK